MKKNKSIHKAIFLLEMGVLVVSHILTVVLLGLKMNNIHNPEVTLLYAKIISTISYVISYDYIILCIHLFCIMKKEGFYIYLKNCFLVSGIIIINCCMLIILFNFSYDVFNAVGSGTIKLAIIAFLCMGYRRFFVKVNE